MIPPLFRVPLASLLVLPCLASPVRSDFVYVSEGGSKVVQYDTSNPAASPVTLPNPGYVGPQGLAVDSSRNLYIGFHNAGVIEKLTPDGIATFFNSPGAINPGTGVPSPEKLAVDTAGNLFVSSNSVAPSRVTERTAGGDVTAYTNLDRSAIGGIAVDSSNNLFVSVSNDNAILKITPGGVISTFYQNGGQDQLLNYPTTLAFDPSGNLYAVSYSGNTIERFTPGGLGSVFASTGISTAVGLGFDSSGNLFVANQGNNTIEKFTSGGVGSVFTTLTSAPFGLAIVPTPAAVPEPSSGLLLGTGVAGLLGCLRHRRIKASSGRTA